MMEALNAFYSGLTLEEFTNSSLGPMDGSDMPMDDTMPMDGGDMSKDDTMPVLAQSIRNTRVTNYKISDPR